MKTHVKTRRVERLSIKAIVLTMLFMMAAPTVPAQPPPAPTPPENILAGALIIPMDNFHQGNAAQTTFNLRAYGLANLFLQNGIPVKWAIKPGKSKDDVDFTASVTRIAGTAGVQGPAVGQFAGGPFIVTREYDTQNLRNLIASFNNFGTPVTVYKTDADASIDIRYTVTHKPKIAIGPDGGNFGAGVYQALFDRAGIPNYTTGIDNIDNVGACFTLATQGHQENPEFVNTYKQFVNSGGNLILQCASIPTFENNLNGHFQTTGAGYIPYSSNIINGNPPTEVNSNAFVFPEGSMPFNQFIGMLADQDGETTEYAYAPGAGPANGNRVSVRNSDPHAEKFVATVSKLTPAGELGGHVFELGGHNYARPDTGETDTELAMLNGQRMSLNAVFVPANSICTAPPQSVIGYKSVRRFNDRVGGPPLIAGDTVEWTIDYINNSQANQEQFQITDIINEFNQHLVFVPGSVTVKVYNGATATVNANFNGDTDRSLLGANAFLPVNGRIQVKLRTVISLSAPRPYTLFNQTTASSLTLAPDPTTKSDAIDEANAAIFSEDPPPPDSIGQIQNGAIINPTRIQIPGEPTSAPVAIEGTVLDPAGLGISNALVTVRNAGTGTVRSIRTNSLGFFRVEGLEAGGIFLVTISHKRYVFPSEPSVYNISDDMTGVTFTGRFAETKR
jgi:uncharacterized repeat protein (TIGR01451 family)